LNQSIVQDTNNTKSKSKKQKKEKNDGFGVKYYKMSFFFFIFFFSSFTINLRTIMYLKELLDYQILFYKKRTLSFRNNREQRTEECV
jgi:hypothetical protein